MTKTKEQVPDWFTPWFPETPALKKPQPEKRRVMGSGYKPVYGTHKQQTHTAKTPAQTSIQGLSSTSSRNQDDTMAILLTTNLITNNSSDSAGDCRVHDTSSNSTDTTSRTTSTYADNNSCRSSEPSSYSSYSDSYSSSSDSDSSSSSYD